MRDREFNELPDMVVRDIVQGLAGKQIGRGASRAVYEWMPDPTLVLKIETAATFQNVMEWEVYSYLVGTDWIKHLAQPVWIGQYGSALLMKKTQPINDSQLPKLLPSWISDRKRENFGWLDGHVVCHDYGVNDLVRTVHRQMRFQAVRPEDWH